MLIFNHDIDDAMRGNVIVHGDDSPKRIEREYLGKVVQIELIRWLEESYRKRMIVKIKLALARGCVTTLSPCEIFFMIEYMIA